MVKKAKRPLAQQADPLVLTLYICHGSKQSYMLENKNGYNAQRGISFTKGVG